MDNQYIRPNQLAKMLGITASALKMRRLRGTDPYTYEIINGKVYYEWESLPESVRVNTNVTESHGHQASRYPLSQLRNINEQRARRHQVRIKGYVRDALSEFGYDPAPGSTQSIPPARETRRSIHDYVRWVDPSTPIIKRKKPSTGGYY